MVPVGSPSSKTSILAPGPLGVEPELDVMLHSTAARPAERLAVSAVNTVFMVPPPVDRRYRTGRIICENQQKRQRVCRCLSWQNAKFKGQSLSFVKLAYFV